MIESVIDAAIPLWNVTLGGLNSESSARDYTFRRIKYDCVTYKTKYSEITPEEYPAYRPDEDWWQYETGKRTWWHDHKELVQPEPDLPFDSLTYDTGLRMSAMDLKEMYGNKRRQLQVIVKLANIELTPEKPEYPGGVWHVEGKLVRLIVFSRA